MLEEKLFETWFGGRVILMGNACQKMVPSCGQGVTVAIQDAVTLANWIVSLQSHTVEDLDTIFKEYRAERYPVVRGEVETSQGFTNILGKNFRSLVVRAILKKLPAWIWRRIMTRLAQNRPQASFLPLVEDNPPLKPKYQASLHKARAILKQRADTKKTRIPQASAPAAVAV
ncbi:hypothetical protein BGZ82_005291 [Podila clonocystis]|nr:hypothetical protein BGZ82_005291 [Podila clonocystis]